MAKMKNNEVRFYDGPKFVTAEPVELTWASVNAPDETYNSYSVEMKVPKDAQWAQDIFQAALDFENANLREQGKPEVTAPACFLTQNGDPRVDDTGEFWMLRFGAKTNPEAAVGKNGDVIPALTRNKPVVYNVRGVKDPEIQIWSGDMCKVSGSLAFYHASGSYGTKFYIKDVQQIVAGPGPTNHNPFGDESSNDDADAATTAATDSIPF